MKVKLTLEYAGDAFCGWQIQPGQRTVQGELQSALRTYLDSVAKKLQLPYEATLDITGSGRTDSGVHARAQVASFRWPIELPLEEYRLKSALNALTPRELCVLSVESRDDDFDARFTPHVKSYSYLMLLREVGIGAYARRAWRVPADLDVGAMVIAARSYRGQHNFDSFRARDCSATSTERTIVRSELTRLNKEELVFNVWGKGFLKQMIRIMTGTLVEVGRKKRSPESILELLHTADRTKAGPTAPPDGLTLDWVRYEGEVSHGLIHRPNS